MILFSRISGNSYFNLKVFFVIYFRYSSSLLLPKTTFPQRLEGAKRIKSDHNIVNSAEFQAVYTSQKSDGPLWLLHDGPPYANGPVHMGKQFLV